MATNIDPQECAQCESRAIRCVGSSGATEVGQFEEVYECQNCGATGKITGEASDNPENWEQQGLLFWDLDSLVFYKRSSGWEVIHELD